MAGFQRNGIGFFENRLFLCPGQNRGDDRLNKNIKIYINIYIEKRGKNIGKCGF
jgi:hypothetical protein